MTEEDRFVEEFGKSFFDGGEAEAQYVYKKLVATGWITEVLSLPCTKNMIDQARKAGVETVVVDI